MLVGSNRLDVEVVLEFLISHVGVWVDSLLVGHTLLGVVLDDGVQILGEDLFSLRLREV